MTQEAFDRLWARVTGAPVPPQNTQDPITPLRRFLDETAQCLALETRLLRCAAAGRSELLRLCRATRARLQRLHAAYYLQTGERWRAPDACPMTRDVLAALRQDCLSASARAGRYDSAAQTEPDKALRELYKTMGEEERAHAAALRSLIARCLC